MTEPRNPTYWDGTTLPTAEYRNSRGHALAEAAHAGAWPEVFDQVRESPAIVNSTRLGGRSGFAALHQAAWHGAGTDVVEKLVAFGAWRTLRDRSGRRPFDIAEAGAHRHLLAHLRPVPARRVAPATLRALEIGLHAVIRGRVDDLVERSQLVLPQVEVLTELAEPRLWFAVPGMYGGFDIKLDGAELSVSSSCRVVGGSGQEHRITATGSTLVAEGFG